jgi:OPA family sugar phosphate sensor protein UhpC-like MFS transporter
MSWGVNWRWCFYAGALFLIIVAIQFYFLQRNKPEDVGLSPIDDPATPIDEATTPEPVSTLPMGLSRDSWINLFLVGGFYFFVKFVRYALWGWAPFFLVQNYGVSGSVSNLYGTAFSVVGMPGIYFTGYLSDRYFNARRAGISTIMMLGMMGATGLLILLSGAGVFAFTLCLALVGFTLFGPDALLTGAGAIDIGGRRGATFAAAFISGLGSTGAIVQELVIGRLYDAKKGDVTAIFILLFTAAALATFFCMILVLRNRRGGKGI